MKQNNLNKTIIKHNKKGLTLLEVLISLILFTFIALSLTRLTNNSIKYTKRVSQNIKITKFSRNVLQIIRKDIRNIFYTQDMNSVAHISFRKENSLPPPLSNNERSTRRSTYRQRQKQEQEKQLTEFEITEMEPYMQKAPILSAGVNGTEDQLSISSLSWTRNRENEKTGDQNLIVYYLKNCKSRTKKQEKSQAKNQAQDKKSLCLWKKVSTMINQDLEDLKFSTEFVLLEKVKKFHLSYYNMYSSEWKKEWKTGPKDKNNLPSAIHITIEFENQKKQIVQQETHLVLNQQTLIPPTGK